MTTKAEVVERLGEKAVLLPGLIGEALAANDRIKLRLRREQQQDENAGLESAARGSEVPLRHQEA